MAAHRYWRLNVSDNNDGFKSVMISDLGFRESIGGANVVPSAMSASSSYDASFLPGNAIDGNNQTSWASAAALPATITADFGGTPRDIVQITMRSRQEAGGNQAGLPQYLPRNCTLEWSDNNTSWTVDQTIAMKLEEWHPLQSRPFTRLSALPVNGKLSNLWRFYGTAEQDAFAGSGAQGGIAIGDVKFFEAATLAPRTTTGTKSPVYFSNPYLALDPAGSWGANHASFPAILEMEFEQALTPTTFSMKSSSTAGLSPTAWKLQYWNGATWVDYFSKTSEPTWGASETRSYSLIIAPLRRRPLIIPN